MISINEAINFAKNTNDDEFTNYILSGMSVPDAIRTIQAMKLDNEVQPQDRAWVNNWLADSVGAFGIGMGNMANDTVVGGLGWALGNIGAGIEKISPFSGTDTEALDTLMRAGVSDEVINSLPLYRDSWFTTGAKGTLWVHNRLEDQLNALRTSWLGKNPSWLAEVSEGSGSSFGFMAVKKLLESNPLTAILAHSGLEALSEAGGFMGDAYRNGMYDRAIGTANKSFATNFLLNAALDYGTGRFSKTIQGIQNPYKKWAAETASEIVNEILQEPSQHVIEEAALNSMRNDTGYLGELGQSVQKWPEIFAQLAPSVASSTALTQALLGLGGMGYNHRYNRDMRTKVPEAIGNLERQQANLNKQADTIDTQRSELLNNQYNYGNAKGNYSSTEGIGVNPANEDMDTNPDYQNDVQKEEADRQARAEKMRSQAEDLRSQSQSITEQLQKLREYAESSPAWVTRDAPQELYDALGKGEDGISMFADDEGLRDDEPNVGTQQETSTSDTIPDDLEGSHTQEERLVDDEPDFDLEEEKDYDTATQEQQQDTQETPSTTPQQEQQNNEPHSMFDDLKGEHDNTQSLIDDEQSETFHQAAHNEDAGTFSFNTKGKSYKFGVTSTNSNGENTISANRRNRYQGRRLEITNSRGQVIATYYPHLGRLDIAPETERKHSRKWLQSFQNQFMSEVNDHLGREGFLDVNGNLASDGNEAFRERWDKRRKNDANSFYDDVAYPEDAYDTTGQAEQQGKSSRGDRFIESIRRAVNGDIYHQGDNQSENVTDAAQSGSADANTFSVRNGEGRYTFKVRAGEFSDKHQTHKKLFGRFLELVDNAGKVIARYSPYSGSFEFSKHAPKDATTRQAIKNTIGNPGNMNMALINNGFIGQNGKLIDDGYNDFRQERVRKRAEARNIANYMRAEKAWRERRAKMSFGERLKEDIIDDTIDSIKGIPDNIKTKWRRGKAGLARAAAGGRNLVYRAIQYMSDLLESDEGKELRENIRDKLNNAGVYNKEQNDALSRVIAAQVMYLASYTNKSPMELLENYFFEIVTDLTPTGGFERDSKTGKIKRNRAGNFQESRGTYSPIEAGEPDHYGNVVDHARNIIYLYRGHDVSTMIHEPAHFFLNVLHDLYRDGALRGRAKQDWDTLVKYLGLEGVDLTKPITDPKNGTGLKETDPEGYNKWHDAQEKFATSAEKFIMLGQAPKLKLTRAFEILKRYMGNVYSAVGTTLTYGENGDVHVTTVDDVIQYTGMDEQEHSYTMSDEAMELMRILYSGKQKTEGKRTAKSSSSTESASEAGETYHQRQRTSETQAWNDTVDRFMNGEISRRNDGNLLHVMDTPAVFTLVGMDRLPIEIHISNMNKILFKKHHIKPETLKQIPQALADPIMIFKSQHDASKDRDSRIVLTELREKDNSGVERSVMAAITLGKSNLSRGYDINELTTVYRKDTSSKQQLTPEEDVYDWITRTFKDGTPMNLLLYVNKEKARQGAMSPGISPLVFDILNGLSDSIPDEHDLARLNSASETYHQSAPKRIRRSKDSFLTPERYEQLVYHGTWHTILGNKFDLNRVGAGSGARLFGWGIYFSDSKDDVQKYRRAGRNTSDTRQQKDEYIDYITGDTHLDAMSMLRRTSYTPHVEKHGNIYVADIPENETLLNWNAKISEQTDTVKNGLRKAVVRAKQLGANDAVLRRLLAAKTGEEFYKTLENYVVPAIMHNIKGASKGFSNDMAASLLLNQAGIPGLYHANAYLDNATLKPKHNRNFVIWNTDMIKLMSISQDSDFDAKNSFIQAKKGDLKSSTKSKDAFTPMQAASLSDDAEQLLNMVEKELASTDGNVYHQLGVFAGESISTDTEQQIDALRNQYKGTESWLKAPNGKKSNLAERDWLLVRTPYFKAIFGDWENNPVSSSKVLDENGEPLVIWGGFNKDGSPASWSDTIIYFFNSEAEANDYWHDKDIRPLFLNLRHPHIASSTLDDISKAIRGGNILDGEYDGIITTSNGKTYFEAVNVTELSAADDYSVLTPKSRKQIEAVRKKYFGTPQWMKAPNGKPTNLTEKQWLQVRTPNFKRWFGDWEKHPELASKVLDENGEPLVVYHGTPNGGFSVFDMDRGGYNTHDTGSWFTSSENAGEFYAHHSNLNKNLYPVFLNIRSPYVHDARGAEWDRLADVQIIDNTTGLVVQLGMDYYIDSVDTAWDYIDEYMLRDELGNRIDNEDEDGNPLYSVETDGLETTDDIVRAVWSGALGDGNHDGVIIRDVVDPEEAIDVYITRTPEHIKSATKNNGEFALKDRDVYHQATRNADEFTLTPEAQKQMEAVRRKYFGTSQWMKAPNGKNSNLTEQQWLAVRTPNFKRWFGDWEHDPAHASKVVDENGEPKVVYHGTGRADRVGSVFDPKRATSGPMAFFTDSRQIAESYSHSKADTSLSREGLDDYKNRFVVKGTKLIDYWYTLSRAEQERIAAIAPTIGYDDNYEIASISGNTRGLGGYEQHIRKARGNHFAALIDEWLSSGTLFNQEENFLDVMHLLGLNNVRYLDPYYREEAVYDTFMNLRNPFDTANISDSDLAALRRSAVAAERHFDPQKAYDSDSWDKTNISPMEWFRNLEEDIQNGTTFAWTQIPDFVTNRLKKLGYDGIVDEGGKYHDEKHTVYIPFASGQIKSSTQNNGEYSHPRDIYHQAADYFRKFQATLTDADPDKIDFGNLAYKGFISDERYHQDSLHGTGYTIEDNKMKLSKVGTGEGGQYRGWGIYSAQARGVAETYRRFGLPQYPSGRKTFSITLKDGSVLDADDYLGTNTKNKAIREIFMRINTLLATTDTIPDSQSIIDNLHSYFSDLYTALPKEIAKREANLKQLEQYNRIPALEWLTKAIKEAKENFKHVDEILKIIDNISDFQISPKPKGNIYHLDVPENDIILNWDAALRNQPKHVRQAIEKIKEFIHQQGEIYRIDTSNIDEAKSGGALYMEIVDVMERYLEHHTPDDGVTQAKKRTSLLFNRFGVPGLRFLDNFSRTPEAGKKKTYNFVTWNEDYIKVLGIEPDSDTEAIEYFERYRAEHPDGFITPEAIERFDQLVTHATGNIILGNKFDLRYVGSSEGGDMFGYGAYFEQSPEVAKSYRRYGLQNMGFDKIDVKLSNGTVLSLTDIYKQLNDLRYNPDTKIKLPAKVTNTALADALKELIHTKIEASRDGSSSWDFSKTIKKLIHDIEGDANEAANNGRVNFSKELRETARALRAIKSMEFFGEKRGNIYQFDIPEGYELLDWDKALNRQSKQITPIVKRIVRAIQNHPEEFISMGLAKNQKDMQKKLQPLLAALARNIKGDKLEGDVHDWEKIIETKFAAMPEYEQLGRFVGKDKRYDAILKLYDYLNDEMITISDTGGELYNKLTDLMYFGDVRDGTYEEESRAAKIAASMYLNSKGIPGHRFLDRGSRDSGEGTHNFVIWNMGRVQMVGIDPSSDQEAIDYYNRTKKMKDLLAQADADARDYFESGSETYHQSIKYSFTMKDGSVFSSSNNPFDIIRDNEALSFVDNAIKSTLNSAAFDKKNLNAQYFLDTLRASHSKGIEIMYKKIEDDEKVIEQLKNEKDKAFVKAMLKDKHKHIKQQINNYKAVLQALDDIADIQFTVLTPQPPKALSLLDILNDTPKGTFEESLSRPLSKQARTQMKAVYKMYHGTDLWMKAPNGKKSNLTERQWLAVRTTLFKAWFGDWENAPEHASKVLDENGEPLVVYHGSPNAGFDVFDTSGEGNSHDTGAWFTSSYENAGSYSPNKYKASIYAVFLNIRNPYIIEGNERNWNELGDITIYDRETGESIYEKDDGEPFASRKDAEDYIANVIGYDPDEDPNNDIVDDEGNHYYNSDFEERYVVEVDEEYSHTNDIVRAVFEGEIYSDNADGVIFKNIYDTGPHEYSEILSDIFVVPDDTNIKSATGNNGKYSNQDGNIYHQLIGVDGARNLDEAEGVTTRMDLLANAERLENSGISAKDIWYYTSWERGKDGNWRYELPYGRVIDRYNFTKQDEAEFSKLWLKSTRGTITPQEDKRLQELQPCFEGVSLADVLDAPELFNAYPALRAIKYQERELKDGYEGFYAPRRKTITMSTHLSGEEFRHYLIHEVQHVIQHLEGFAGGSGFLWDDDEKHIQLRDRAEKILDRLNDDSLKAEWLAAIDDFDNAKIRTLLNGVTDINQRQIYLELQKVYYAICKRYDKVYEQYARKSGEVEARNASTRSTMTEKQRELKPPFATEDIPRDKQTIGRRMRKLSMSAGDTYAPKAKIRRSNDSFITPQEIERFEQLAFHGAGYIVLGNRFSLKYIGTGQGKQSFGWGLYFAENRAVAEGYRYYRLPEGKNGNIYKVDIPENDVLLDLDVSFTKQPEKVKKAWQKVIAKVKRFRASNDAISRLQNAKTGEEFYKALESYVMPEFMDRLRKRNQLPDKINRADMAASLMLNQAGIPGLRFLDGFSRNRKNGTHNFIIWNTDMIQILGLTEDSDEDAKEYFERTKKTRSLLAQSDADVYHQAVRNADNFTLTPEAQRQMDEVRRKYEGTPQWMKAPNGSPTFLTEQQWLAVRTPIFKQWFGDWERDPANASKVLDENGEPLVVYHGTPEQDITVFKPGTEGWLGAGIYTTPDIDYARAFAGENGIVMSLFLKLRNPLVITSANPVRGILRVLYGDRADAIYKERYDAVRSRDFEKFNARLRDSSSGNLMRQSFSRYAMRYIITEAEVQQLLAQGYDGINWDNGEYSVLDPNQVKSATHNNGDYSLTDTDQYHQMGRVHKRKMLTLLAEKRPDLTPKQHMDAINAMEKLGGNPNIGNTAAKWMSEGHITLPEDGYKILDAVKICEQQHLAPMSFDDPNEILAETYHQNKRINPETMSELSEKSIISDKVDYANGITVYSVADTKAGQEAVRRIIDECWGKDANPWCLAARQNGSLYVPLPAGKSAWDYWKHYGSIPKRIAFKDGKLVAFGASDKGKTEWWDKEDISSSGIPYFVKERDRTKQYTFNEENSKICLVRELVKRNQAKIYYYEDTGTVKSIRIPGKTKDDYTEFRYDKDRHLKYERKPDRREIHYNRDGSIAYVYNPNHVKYSYYPNGNRRHGVREDGAEFHYYENGNMELEFYPDDWGDADAEITYYESGYVKDEYYSDGTLIHHEENEQVTQPSRREQYHQAAKRSDFSSRINSFFDVQDTFVGMDGKGQQQAISIPEQQLNAVRRQYEGTAQWLKAPNGKPTKLTEKQWLQVRTQNFKRWFGDWENTPENASKVLDENGEPLVVTHISRNGGGFSIFDTNGSFSVDYGSKTKDTGAWFADFKDKYDDMASNLEDGYTLYHVFLNIRNPYIYDAEGKRWQRVGKVWIEDDDGNRIYHDDDGRAFSNLRWAQAYIRDNLDDDRKYHVEFTKEFQTSDQLVRAVREGIVGNGDHDGVIITNLRDMSYWGVDDYIIFNSEQVKSATDNNGNFDPVDPDIYHQAVMKTDEFAITTEAQKQMEEVRTKYEGTVQWLKAPNGKPTNLTEQQWLTVRTSNFKRWFGDWENTPEHASKVLDENGEPLVVYHGTPKGGFSVFKTEGTGAWFSSSYDTARTYTYGGKKQSRQVYAVFLNIHNPFIYKAKGRKSNQLSDVWVYNHDTGEKLETKQDGSYFLNQNDAYEYISDVLGDKNHEHYDILIDDKYYLTDDIVRAVWNRELGNGKHDGIIFRNIDDDNVDSDGFSISLSNVYVVPTTNAIKSATNNNGEYSSTNPDIYHQSVRSDKQERKLTQKAQKVAKRIGRFGQDTIEQYFQRWGRSPADNEEVQRLLERNRRAEPAFRRLMNELQQELGGELITRKQMKTPERIIAKANRIFGGDISRVGDVLAGTLVYDTEDEMFDALSKLEQRDDLVELRNRWNRPKRSSGYRDIISHLELEDGTVVELQLNLKAVQEIKDNAGHSFYEFIRANKYNDDMQSAVWQAGYINKKLYAAGMDGSYDALSTEEKDILRTLSAHLAQTEDPEDAEQIINELYDFLDAYLLDTPSLAERIPNSSSLTIDPIAEQYIYETRRSIIAPMDSLILTEKVTPYSISKAKANMQDALNGYMSKRKPLTVRQRRDGYYDILDGNNTYSALRELGAENVPVEVIGSSYRADSRSRASLREQFSQFSVRYDAVSSSTNARDLSGASIYTRPDGIKSSGMSYSPSRYSTANGAPSLLMKYSNILNNSNPDDIDVDNLTTGNEGFISNEIVERYNQNWQDSWHGTFHTLLENRIMIDAGMGTGEGSQAFGYGAYSGQARGTGVFYANLDIPNFGMGTAHIRTKDGATYSTKDTNAAFNGKGWDNAPDAETTVACHVMLLLKIAHPNADIEYLKECVRQDVAWFINPFTSHYFFVNSERVLEVIDSIDSLTFTPDENSGRKGNLYNLHVP